MVNEELCFITIDDDPAVSRILEKTLAIPSRSFLNLQAFMASGLKLSPVAVFVDIFLGNGELGFDVVDLIKKRWPFAPVIVITSSDSEEMLELAFKVGADDFVRKPLNPAEVRQRFQIRVQSAREWASQTTLAYGEITLDLLHRTLSGPLGRVFLAPVETLLLAQLMRARGSIIQKEVLKREAWGLVKVSDNAYYRKLFELRRMMKDVTANTEIISSYGSGLKLNIIEGEEDQSQPSPAVAQHRVIEHTEFLNH